MRTTVKKINIVLDEMEALEVLNVLQRALPDFDKKNGNEKAGHDLKELLRANFINSTQGVNFI